MIHNHLNDPVVGSRSYHVSWSAILIGALVGVGLGFLLNLYGVAIGLSAYSSSADGAQVLAIGGFLGMLIGVIASMLAAGYTAGYLARGCCWHNHLGIIYGFATWCAALILSALLVMPASKYVAAYTHSLSRTVSTATDGDNSRTMSATHPADAPARTVAPSSDEAENLAWSAWLVFLMFFIGAISSCVGASWAICCYRRDDRINPDVK